MDPKSDGCRLCLDPFADRFTTIDSPELKGQMEKVFCFSIESKEEYCSSVCQSCSYAVSEFYQYSEKVRHNQELLSGNVANCPALDSKIIFESIKVETLSDSGLPEMTEGEGSGEAVLTRTEAVCEPKAEVLGEEVPPEVAKITFESVKVEPLSNFEGVYESKDEDSGEEVPDTSDDESYEPPAKKSQTKGKRQTKLGNSEADKPTQNSAMDAQQEQNDKDQLLNKYIPMVCDLCGMSTATFPELVHHFRNEHNRRNGYVVCCNKKLFKRYAILNHIEFHANPDAFRCDLCGNKYKNKDTLETHMLYRHSSAGSFKCDHCPQSFALKSALSLHMQQHMKFNCPECNKELGSKQYLKTHMATQHSDKGRTMVCDICGKEFLTKQYFDRHMKEHMGIEVPRIQCEICQRWLKGRRGFRVHMNTVHSEDNLQCDVCLQKYPHARALYEHRLLTHTEPKHECEVCGKKYKKLICLKEHRAIHTNDL